MNASLLQRRPAAGVPVAHQKCALRCGQQIPNGLLQRAQPMGRISTAASAPLVGHRFQLIQIPYKTRLSQYTRNRQAWGNVTAVHWQGVVRNIWIKPRSAAPAGLLWQPASGNFIVGTKIFLLVTSTFDTYWHCALPGRSNDLRLGPFLQFSKRPSSNWHTWQTFVC